MRREPESVYGSAAKTRKSHTLRQPETLKSTEPLKSLRPSNLQALLFNKLGSLALQLSCLKPFTKSLNPKPLNPKTPKP